MLDSLSAVYPAAVVLLTTYLLHSSLLLALAWLVQRRLRTPSHVLTERLWKTAAVTGLLTAPLQLAGGFSQPLVSLPLTIVADSEESSPDTTGFEAHGYPRADKDAGEHETPAVLSVSELASSDSRDLAIPVPGGPVDDSVLGSNAVTRPDAEWTVSTDVAPHSSRETWEPVTAEQPSAATAPAPPSTDDLPESVAAVVPVAVEPHTAKPAEAVSLGWRPAMVWFEAIVVACAFSFVVAGALRLIWQTCSLQDRLRRCHQIVDGPAREVLDELIQGASVRGKVTLLVSKKYPEPLAFGVFRWRILLPAGIEQRLSRDELTALLAHELAHLVRRDTAWLWVGRVLCSCLAFQPLNLVARRRWQQAAEYQCDDWAVRHAVDRFSLARCLTRVAEWRLGRRVCPAMLAAGGAKSNLSDRVERLVGHWHGDDPWAGRFRHRAVIGVSFAMAMLLACWGPRATLPAGSAAEDGERASTEVRAEESLLTDEPDDVAAAIASQFDAIQHELESLQHDLDQLNQALEHSGARPEVRAMVQRLETQMDRLRDRRDSLTRLLVQFEKEFER